MHRALLSAAAVFGVLVGELAGMDPPERASRPATTPASAPAGCLFLPAGDLRKPPAVVALDLPDFPGTHGIFGGTGRDSRGHVWIGVCARQAMQTPSAHLLEFVPETGTILDRGDVRTQLQRLGLLRDGEGQNKIHSRIVQASDGDLYFTSMDEAGEDQRRGTPPQWGSHLWRLRPDQPNWQHVLAAPEGLIAVSGGGRRVYALGYFTHMLYQCDTATGKVAKVEVGSTDGHVTRNFFSDGRDHVYVPRVRRTGGRLEAGLVEFDESLRELAETPLPFYRPGLDTHGITGVQPLADGRIAFVTHDGYLHTATPQPDGPAKIKAIGYMHPNGKRYIASLFTADGTQVLGVSSREHGGGGLEWVVYDLATDKAAAWPFDTQPASLGNSYLYGSITRDNAGRFYVTGMRQRGTPVLLQVSP